MGNLFNEQDELAQKIKEFKSNTKGRNPNIMKEKPDVIMRWHFLKKYQWIWEPNVSITKLTSVG